MRLSQWLRTLVALGEDLGAVLSPYMAPQLPHTPIPEDLSGLHRHCTDIVHGHTCRKTLIHVK